MVTSRAYRAAVGGERACNPRSANVDGEILIVTKNSKTFNEQTSIGNVCTLFLATYFHAKPLLVAPKIQKATPIVETSENEAILESIRDGGDEKQL